jgi:hypothetical protein
MLHTVIVKLELGVCSDDGRKKSNRRLVCLPVRHGDGWCFVLYEKKVSIEVLQVCSNY